MNNYTTPKDWPVIRWISLIIVGAGCWYLARGMAREVGNAITTIWDAQIIHLLGYVTTYFCVLLMTVIWVGIPAMAAIETLYKFIRNE